MKLDALHIGKRGKLEKDSMSLKPSIGESTLHLVMSQGPMLAKSPVHCQHPVMKLMDSRISPVGIPIDRLSLTAILFHGMLYSLPLTSSINQIDDKPCMVYRPELERWHRKECRPILEAIQCPLAL
jgi:hypothetical protein